MEEARVLSEESEPVPQKSAKGDWYKAVWRWHFYAGAKKGRDKKG